MADKTIAGLTAAGAITGAELVHVEQSGNSRKVSIDNILGSSPAAEMIRDVIGSALVQGTGITLTVSDAGNTITIALNNANNSFTGLTTFEQVAVSASGASGGIRLERGTDGGYVGLYDEAAARHGFMGFPAGVEAGPAGTGNRIECRAESPMIGFKIGGDLIVTGGAMALHYRVGNIQVLGARITGWAAATGTKTRTTFDTATVTLPQLAERVAALIDDARTHGFIGT